MHDFGATRVNSSIHTGATRASKASTHMIAHQTEVLFIKTGEAISIGCGVAYVTSDNQSRHAAYAVVSLDRAVVTSTQSGGLRCDRVFLHPCQNPTQIFMNDLCGHVSYSNQRPICSGRTSAIANQRQKINAHALVLPGCPYGLGNALFSVPVLLYLSYITVQYKSQTVLQCYGLKTTLT